MGGNCDGAGDGWVAAGMRKHPLPGDDLRVVARCERLVSNIWLHVDPTRSADEASISWALSGPRQYYAMMR